jgi:hypothetical protein
MSLFANSGMFANRGSAWGTETIAVVTTLPVSYGLGGSRPSWCPPLSPQIYALESIAVQINNMG